MLPVVALRECTARCYRCASFRVALAGGCGFLQAVSPFADIASGTAFQPVLGDPVAAAKGASASFVLWVIARHVRASCL